MQKSCNSLFSNVIQVVVFALALASSARADKTVMWLIDWYSTNMDSVVSMDSVYIPHYTGGTNGYYFGTADQLLTKTTAYAPQIPVHVGNTYGQPTGIDRWWYSLPSWSSANYNGGLISVRARVSISNHAYYGTLPLTVQTGVEHLSTGEMNRAKTDAGIPGWLDQCANKIKGDTVWVRSNPNPAEQNYVDETKQTCYDHNPFLQLVGTVHVLNPWPGKPLFIQMGDQLVPTYPDSARPGWSSATLYTDPRNPLPFQVRLTNATSNPAQFLDAGGMNVNASGVPFDFTTSAGPGKEVWIVPPLVAATSTITTTAPAVAMTLYVQNPTWGSSTIRLQWQGQDARFVPTATKYCKWFQLTLYTGAVPSKFVIRQTLADTLYGSKGQEPLPVSMANYANWISIPPVGTSAWVSTPFNSVPVITPNLPAGTGTCDTKVLAFSGYDYTTGDLSNSPTFYPPFAETNSGVNYPGTLATTDNCTHSGGGVTTGLVKPVLNARGRPEWSGKVDCDIGKTTDGPQYWFDSLWKSSTGVISNTRTAGATQMNAFHCIRDTLTLDATGYYRTSQKDSLNYWPFDTATAVPAPFRAGTPNFHFAMHAKAAFEYTTGLKFSFAGDDDLWIFIDKKLALDLGGQHGRQKGSIDLDRLGLVEGKSYQFDMFYTERHTMGSEMFMSTTMNLVPTIDVHFDTTNSTVVTQDFITTTSTTTNRQDVCPEEGSATSITYSPARASIVLMFPDGTSQNLDSTFNTIYPGITITDGNSHLNTDTLRIQQSGRLALSGVYQIIVSVGTESRTVTFSVVSNSVEINGTLFDANGDGHPDSVSLQVVGGASTFKNVTSAILRWADSTGLPDSIALAGTSFTHSPSEGEITARFILPFRTNCPPAGCAGAMGEVITTQGASTLVNQVRILSDGMAPVANSAWLVYDTTGVGKDTLYVEASESLVSSLGALLPQGDSVYLIAGQSSAPRPVSGTAILVGTLLKLPIDPASNPIQPGDSIRLGGYSGDALGNAPGLLSRWVALTANPVAKSWMLDIDGDGYPDSIGVESKGSLAFASFATIHWRTGSGLDTSFAVPTVGGMAAGIKLPVGILRDATYCEGCLLDVTSGAEIKRFALLDSVPPVAVRASLVFGLEVSDADTVRIQASESLARLLAGTFAMLGRDSASATPTLLTATNSNPSISGSVIKIAVPAGAIANDIAWVRLGTAISDGHKFVGASSRWVKLELQPSGRAYLFDANGDGQADSMSVYVRGGLQATQAVLHWKTAAGTDDQRTWPITPTTGPFGIGIGDAANWFERGATSCSNCTVTFMDALGKPMVEWPLIDSVAPMALLGSYRFGATMDTLTVSFSEALASVSAALPWLEWGNTVVGGVIHHSVAVLNGSTATFYLTPSNGAVDGWDSLRLAAGLQAGNVTDLGGKVVGATSPWAKILYGIPPFQAYLLDPDGTGRGTNVRVTLTHPVPQAAVSAIQSFQFSWTNDPGTGLDIRSELVSSLAWDGVSGWTGVLAQPFALGRTGCSGACFATALALDNTSLASPLVDSVPPSAVRARFRYSQPDVALDTLELGLSETWIGEDPGNNTDPFAAIGHPGDSIDVANFVNWTLSDDKLLLRLIVTSAFEKNLEEGDSARLAYLPQGSRVWDAFNNQVGVRSRWVPIEFGLRPPVLDIHPYRQVLQNTPLNPWELPPASFPQTELFLVNPKDSSLTKISPDGIVGGAPINEMEHTLGVEIRINRPLDGVLIIYDNSGTSVVSVDLTPMKTLWEGQEDRDRIIRVAWNGTGPDHKFAASGVYLFRAYVKYEDQDGNREFRNIVWKLGFHRNVK